MNINELKVNILKLRDIKEEINEKLTTELEALEKQLDNGIITEDEQEELEDNLYLKYDIDTLNSKLLKLENEFIKAYKDNISKQGLYKKDLDILFEQAKTNIIVHDKIINKILL